MTLEPAGARRAGAQLEGLVAQAARLSPMRTAVVHPVDELSLAGALAAAGAGLMVPVLVGPEGRIRAAAGAAGLRLDGIEIVPTEYSQASAARAVALARAGEVAAIMKGALHTDELLRAALDPACGLRTARRMSHVFVCDTALYPRLLLITDAAVNIYPTLTDKRDIVQNAIDLAHALGIASPRVAILSAIETVSEQIRSTIDAAALCKMADRGQITGGVLDGPLAFDNAVSPAAAVAKHLHSPVMGVADILVVPDLEAGNMLAKQLEYLAGAVLAGVALGARVPIILTSRADPTVARLSSTAIARLLAAWPQSHYAIA
jgi:phosphate acetyltransferase/phosphate butyryltransferase